MDSVYNGNIWDLRTQEDGHLFTMFQPKVYSRKLTSRNTLSEQRNESNKTVRVILPHVSETFEIVAKFIQLLMNAVAKLIKVDKTSISKQKSQKENEGKLDVIFGGRYGLWRGPYR